MWEVVNRTPFVTQGYFVRDGRGAEHWCLALRALFGIAGREPVRIAAKQEGVRVAPVFQGENSEELLAESDFAPFRPSADILIAGQAVALDGAAFRTQKLAVRLGKMQKQAIAVRPRRIRKTNGDWQATDAEPTTSVALTWRNALGGRDPFAAPDDDEALCADNPIGKGWCPRIDDAPEGAEIDLPQIEDAEYTFHPEKAMPTPTGFGPLPPAWPARLGHAGNYDDNWQENRAPLLPVDFSDAFYQAAPPDQIYPGELKGGEPVALSGFHPDGACEFWLPQIIIEARSWIGRGSTTHRFRIVSVTIDATARTLDMTWNASIPCPHGDHLVDRSLIWIKQMAGVA